MTHGILYRPPVCLSLHRVILVPSTVCSVVLFYIGPHSRVCSRTIYVPGPQARYSVHTCTRRRMRHQLRSIRVFDGLVFPASTSPSPRPRWDAGRVMTHSSDNSPFSHRLASHERRNTDTIAIKIRTTNMKSRYSKQRVQERVLRLTSSIHNTPFCSDHKEKPNISARVSRFQSLHLVDLVIFAIDRP